MNLQNINSILDAPSCPKISYIYFYAGLKSHPIVKFKIQTSSSRHPLMISIKILLAVFTAHKINKARIYKENLMKPLK